MICIGRTLQPRRKDCPCPDLIFDGKLRRDDPTWWPARQGKDLVNPISRGEKRLDYTGEDTYEYEQQIFLGTWMYALEVSVNKFHMAGILYPLRTIN